ncbi:MAG: hypothetical protein AAF570_13790 [Bacteroidota bacterium]
MIWSRHWILRVLLGFTMVFGLTGMSGCGNGESGKTTVKKEENIVQNPPNSSASSVVSIEMDSDLLPVQSPFPISNAWKFLYDTKSKHAEIFLEMYADENSANLRKELDDKSLLDIEDMRGFDRIPVEEKRYERLSMEDQALKTTIRCSLSIYPTNCPALWLIRTELETDFPKGNLYPISELLFETWNLSTNQKVEWKEIWGEKGPDWTAIYPYVEDQVAENEMYDLGSLTPEKVEKVDGFALLNEVLVLKYGGYTLGQTSGKEDIFEAYIPLKAFENPPSLPCSAK